MLALDPKSKAKGAAWSYQRVITCNRGGGRGTGRLSQ